MNRLLTIAGSDSGGGAGIQADLKTFFALAGYGMSAITALTAQNTLGVKSIYSVSPAFVEDQISAVFEDIGVDAVKIGMLHSADIIHSVVKCLLRYRPSLVVLDPVMVSKSGHRLLENSAIDVLKSDLIPEVTIFTPNLPEAELLSGRRIGNRFEMEHAADDFLKTANAVVIKGGHLSDEYGSPDLFRSRKGERLWMESTRLATKNTHGTGCTYSAAIAAFLGKGDDLKDAIQNARRYVQAAIFSGSKFSLGSGVGPLDHQLFHKEKPR